MDALFVFIAKYLYLAPIVAVIIYFLRSPGAVKQKILIFLLISLPLTYMLGVGARASYFNPRPFVVEGFEPLIRHEADNGFPSDHLLLLSALASGMLFFDKRFSLFLWGIAVLVAAGRVYVGVHHLLDVSASVVIALLCAILVDKALKIYAR